MPCLIYHSMSIVRVLIRVLSRCTLLTPLWSLFVRNGVKLSAVCVAAVWNCPFSLVAWNLNNLPAVWWFYPNVSSVARSSDRFATGKQEHEGKWLFLLLPVLIYTIFYSFIVIVSSTGKYRKDKSSVIIWVLPIDKMIITQTFTTFVWSFFLLT